MRLLSTGVFCMCALSAQANVIQYFAGISYNNPSQLFKVKKNEFILGGTGSYANLEFQGSALNFNTGTYESGFNYSRTYTLFPYGRIAQRLNEKTVFAVDVTEPFNSNLNWGTDAFTRYAVTQNIMTDVDVSPKIAYSLNKKLQIGGGVNFNFISTNEINWAMPTSISGSSNLVNKTSSFGIGYNLGFTWIFNETNFLDFVYYSTIRQKTRGFSMLDNNVSTDLMLHFTMPATSVLSYVHIFNQSWLINLKAFQSQWNKNQTVNLLNTAASPPFTDFHFNMHFKRSYAYLAAVRKQYNEKTGITLLGMIDFGPEQNELRTLTFPSYTQYFVGLVGDYQLTKQTTIELLYGHVISTPPINNSVTTNNGTIPFTTGRVNINVDVVDLRVKVVA